MTTDEVSALIDVPANNLRDWLRRGKILSGPKSNGQLGKNNCLYWSPEAIDEAKAHKATLTKRRSRSRNTPEELIFFSMRARCRIKTNKDYHKYGARGITVCDRWLERLNGLSNFLEDMGYRPSPSHTLDRIDNDLGYSKENCRWTTETEQTRNRRVTLRDEDGTPLAEIADRLGVKYMALYSHYRRGKRGHELRAALAPVPPGMHNFTDANGPDE
jgi:hypothetical protein